MMEGYHGLGERCNDNDYDPPIDWKQRAEKAEASIKEMAEACRETSDDWAPEQPPYAAADLIERIEGIIEGDTN